MKKHLTAALAALLLAAAPAAILAQAPDTATAVETAEPRTPEVGEIFPDFTGMTYDGKEVTLSKSLGKVTLVDFWATWCGPCIAELPYVRTAYKDLHDKGFNIVAVSLDSKKEALQKFYENPETTLPWPSTFDGKGWKTEISTRFGIRSIPATFLLDAEGRVIATNLRGNELYRQVAKRIAPGMEPPPSLEEYLMKYAADKDARKDLEPKIIELAAANQMMANSFSWEELDREGASKEMGALAYAMLKPSIDAGKDPMVLDTAALAAYVMGDAKEALRIQQLAVDIQTERMTKAGAPADKISADPMMLELNTRLALFKAASGDGMGAGKILAEIKAHAGEEGAKGAERYFRMAKELADKKS